MGFQKLLERLGFVRLRDYGLLLTPDGRVVTTRRILDDGFGAVVVGYANGDLAGLELATPPPLAAATIAPLKPPAASPTPIASLPATSTPAAISVPTMATPAALSSPATSTPAAISVPTPMATPAISAPSVEPEEDDWEWEIAMARARAVEQPIARAAPHAAAAATSTSPSSSSSPSPSPSTSISPWSTGEETATAIRHVRPHASANALPRTIIPVPSLPVANDPQEVTRQLPLPVRRLARGTGSVRG